MADYTDIRSMARLATEDYSSLDSLQQISRDRGSRFEKGYPAHGSPNWWALRIRYEQLLLGKVRKERAASKLRCDEKLDEWDAAKWAALGNEQADRDYQGFVPSATEVHDRRRNWLDIAMNAARLDP